MPTTLRTLGVMFLALVAGLEPRLGLAGDPPPTGAERGWTPATGKNLLHYTNLAGVRLNPLGIVDQLRLGYRRLLWSRPGPLFSGAYFDAKLHAFLNPAFAQVGPLLEFMPLAVLRLSARYTYTAFWGSFGSLHSFPSSRADAAPSTLLANQRAGLTYATGGHVVTLQGLLQAQKWDVAVRNEVTAQWSLLDLRAGDSVFFEQTFDVLAPNGGWVLVDDADLFYLFDNGLTLGARYTLTHAFYGPRHFEPGEPQRNPNTPHHRVGPAVLYTFFEAPGARFDRVTGFVLAQWWARHRYRSGQDTSAAMPYLVLGLSFEGQLWPTSPRFPHGTARRARRRSAGP